MKNVLLSNEEDVTIGADPELFLVDKENSIVPACGLIGGNKENPLVVCDGNLQEDNIMAEFAVDISLTEKGFIRRINSVFKQLGNRTQYDLLIKASAIIDKDILDNTKGAKEFGCDPDFNAYTMERNETPDVESNLRTCAGHAHMGFETNISGEQLAYLSAHVVKYCDAVVGLWTLLVDPDTRRRTRYGMAGAFRPKSYGLEYRVPSNFWLRTDALKGELFRRMKKAYTMAREGVPIPSTRIRDAINSSDTTEAVLILEELSCLNV